MTESEEKFNESIKEYREKVTALITKLVGAYRTCLETRTEKITERQTTLEGCRDTYIEDLTKSFEAVRILIYITYKHMNELC